MRVLSRSVILIGFKHVGKSVLGRALALRLSQPFIDLDEVISSTLSCREIMQTQGEAYFRQLEKKALVQVMQAAPAIISLGGGTPMDEESQRLLKDALIIHVMAAREVVFERMMLAGLPAFFAAETPPLETFNRLWDERQRVYQSLAHLSIDNQGTITAGVDRMLEQLCNHI